MIQSITYKGKKYPYRIGYRALKKVKFELDREFEYSPDSLDYEALEALLFYAIEGECIKESIEMDIKREDMEFVLDECLLDLIQSIRAFSQAAEKAAQEGVKH